MCVLQGAIGCLKQEFGFELRTFDGRTGNTKQQLAIFLHCAHACLANVNKTVSRHRKSDPMQQPGWRGQACLNSFLYLDLHMPGGFIAGPSRTR